MFCQRNSSFLVLLALTSSLLLLILEPSTSFIISSPKATFKKTSLSQSSTDEAESGSASDLLPDGTFEIAVALPPVSQKLMATLKFKPLVTESKSTIVAVRYAVPFGLDVAPQNGLAVCTKDGANGEKVGDILRFTSQWTMGLPRGDGIMTTAASFSGGIGWQVSLFDVMKAKSWDAVVEALLSNTQQRTDEVVLIFERPLPDSDE